MSQQPLGAHRRPQMDYTLLLIAVTLVCWGVVMIYSASAIWAEQNMNNSLYFFKRQIIWALASFAALAFFSRYNYNRLREHIGPIFALTCVALVVALVSPAIAGVRRWVRLGPIGLQPAEFAKLTSVLFLAYYLDRKRSKLDSPLYGLLIPIAVVGVLLLLIGKEPDLGTPSLMFAVMLLLIFVGGGKAHYILGAVSVGAPVVLWQILRVPYRRARFLTFMDPFANMKGAGYQLAQSILAVGSGGWFGKGFGASKLKLMYLPTPHTDFIFPVVCEELGLLGALILLMLFVGLLIRGVKIARHAPNLFGTLLAAGITFTICLQAFFNVGMSIGLLPTKGIPLPFISFGGSSLLATLIGIGILLNISRQTATAKETA